MRIMKKFINGKYYDVYVKEELPVNYATLNSNTAILEPDGTILPLKSEPETGPGYYDCVGDFKIRIPPREDQREQYSTSKDFIDFSSAENLRDYLVQMDREKQFNQSTICNVENEYKPMIKPSDDPFMKLVKSAIHEKHLDISKYKNVFGPNFNNDKRSLEAKSITLNKASEILTKLGIEIFIGLKNSEEDVPNPMRNDVYGTINSPDFEVCIGPIKYDAKGGNEEIEIEEDYDDNYDDEEDDD